jgi:hypothetical protein
MFVLFALAIVCPSSIYGFWLLLWNSQIFIPYSSQSQLLGVTFDFKLTFNSHVSHICKKASQQLNVLKRIGNNLSKHGKLTIYYSFILSNYNYCPLVWHFCGESNTKKLEKIQERALRFIYNDSESSYENLLEKSQLPSLRLRRLRSMAIEVFKIINKQTWFSNYKEKFLLF